MEAIPANAATPINGYTGRCTLCLTKHYISIKIDHGSELGTWPYESIRRFYTHDLVYFAFTSGRRGPFGVADYKFGVTGQNLILLQQTLTQYTGAQFDPPPPPRSASSRTSSESSISSNSSRHSTTSSTTSTTSTSRLPYSSSSSIHPGYSTMTVGGAPPDADNNNAKYRHHHLPPSPSPHSPRLSRAHKNKSFEENRSSRFSRGDSSSPISSLMEATPTSPSVRPSRVSSLNTHSTLLSSPTPPSTPRTPKGCGHKYEEAETRFLPPPLKLSSSTLSNSGSDYDKLISRSPSTSTMPSYETVERRIKSPSPKSDGNGGGDSPPLTDKELSHMRYFNKEPLINTSNTVHNRRNAEYIYIDIPDSSSDCTDGTDSRPGSIYDIPSNKPLADQSNPYDVLPPSRPVVPVHSPTSSLYDSPRPTRTSTESLSPHYRALPHLPNDYVNVKFNPLSEENGLIQEDLYAEIPDPSKIQKTLQQVSSSSEEVPGQKLAQELAEEEGYILVNPATLPALVSPPPTSATPTQNSPPTLTDEYIEVRRTDTLLAPHTATPIKPIAIKHEYVNVPFLSRNRDSDGYEEVTELRKVCPLRSASSSSVATEECPVTIDGLSLSPDDLMTTRVMSPPRESYYSNCDEKERGEGEGEREGVVSSNESNSEGKERGEGEGEEEKGEGEGLVMSLHESNSEGKEKEEEEGEEDMFCPSLPLEGDSGVWDHFNEHSNESLEDVTRLESKPLEKNTNETLESNTDLEITSNEITSPSDIVSVLSTKDNTEGSPEGFLAKDLTGTLEENPGPLEENPGPSVMADKVTGPSESDLTEISTELDDSCIEMSSLPEDDETSLSPSLPSPSPSSLPNTIDQPLSPPSSLPIAESHQRISYEHHIPNSIPIPQAYRVPVATGSPTSSSLSHTHLLRKRSLTIGDPLDASVETKKHTYVNVQPGDANLTDVRSAYSFEQSPPINKKPMPLPRPVVATFPRTNAQANTLSLLTKSMSFQSTPDPTKETCFPLTVNTNCNNNYCSKVRTLIRQFSD